MEHWNLGKQTSSLQEIRKRKKARNRGKDGERHENRKKYWKGKEMVVVVVQRKPG